MSFTSSQLFVACLLSFTLYVFLRRKRRDPYPPGPKSLPLIGNLRDIPFKYQWLTYERWGRETGSDIIHAELFGRHVVVLNSEKAANDLFDKRSSTYSDRPQVKAITELLDTGNWVFAFFPYGNKWRKWHKAFLAHMQPTVARQYHPFELKAARRLLWNLFDTPQDFMQHIRHMIGQVSLSVAYGIDTAPRDDPNIALAEAALRGMAVAQTKGRIFNMVPFLIHLPWWFPGAGFKKEAKTWKRNIERCRDGLYETVKKQLSEDKAVPSIAATMITELSEDSTEEAILMAKALPGNIYLIGIDSTSAALQSFVLAMVLYPDAQKRAQEEIDSILGHGHFPHFGDTDALPYLKAVLYEVLRWACPAPLGLPHRVTEDDIYNGYFIPAGSLVFANIWAILHDPATYPEPLKFKPERFLDPMTSAQSDLVFGFGRRFCPGRFFASDMLWLAMANMLATFEFLPATDAEGRPAPPAQQFTSLYQSGPIPFKCTIKPRIPNAKESLLMALQD